jgi:signal peptidase
MAKGSSSAKKVFSVIVNVVIWLFVIFAIIVTVLTFAATSNKDNVPELGGRVLLKVESDSMEPTFKKGDLIIGKKLTDEEKFNLKPKSADYEGDIVTYEADLANDNSPPFELNSHRIVDRVDGDKGFAVSYDTMGDGNNGIKMDFDKNIKPSNVKYKYTGIRIPFVGNVLSFLQTQKGFLIAIVLPMVLFFLYELIRFVKRFTEIKNEGKAEMTAEDEERIKQQAVAEYLKAQSAAAEAAKEQPPTDQTETPAEEAPAEEASEEAPAVEEESEAAQEEPAQPEKAEPVEQPAEEPEGDPAAKADTPVEDTEVPAEDAAEASTEAAQATDEPATAETSEE